MFFCSFPQELEGIQSSSAWAAGSFPTYLESLAPTEDSLCFEGCGNFPITLIPPYLFPKITTFGGNHYF